MMKKFPSHDEFFTCKGCQNRRQVLYFGRCEQCLDKEPDPFDIKVTQETEPLPEIDPVNQPPHYNQASLECIDAMAAAFGEDNVRIYSRVNAFKYLWRAAYKNGEEDIRKAIWYLRRSLGEDPRA